MSKAGLTYKKAGVDVAGADVFIKRIRPLAKLTARPEVLKDIGSFGGLFGFKARDYKEPVLVSSCDGVGTKLKLAFLLGRHDTVGIDAVAMNVNDILCAGAEPLFFLDYIACAKLDEAVLLELVRGISKGCAEAGCALIGGETAQMPDIYRQGEYDLAGFCVGAVEREDILDGSRIAPQDKLIGLASSGLHSNGFSLARKVFRAEKIKKDKKLQDWLLAPTRIYTRQVLALKEAVSIKGLAHITGGAFYAKLPRILPAGLAARIYKNSWPLPEIFKLIQNKGNIDEREMYRTFNMGIGMVLVTAASEAENAQSQLGRLGVRSWVIGEIVKGQKGKDRVMI